MDSIKKEQLMETISMIKHPAIDLSLLELGLVKDIKTEENKVSAVFAFPFPNIPIAEQLINSIANPVKNLGYEFSHEIVIMTEDEKQTFLKLEASAWKGL